MAGSAALTRLRGRLRRPERSDFVWAAVLAVWIAVSPTTGTARIWLSALLGAGFGVLVLAVRLWLPRPGRPAGGATGVRVGPSVWLALLCVVLAFAPTIAWLFEQYTYSVWRNTHGILVPLGMFLLGRSALRRDPHPDRVEQSPLGFVFLLAGLGIATLDAGAETHYASAVGLVVTLPGLCLLFLGARRTRALAGALALAAFLFPFPKGTSDPIRLMEGSSVIAEAILRTTDLPFIRRETHFITGQAEIGVSQNCSGYSTVQAAFALAFALALAARGWRGRLVPLLLAYPITLLLNSLRLVGIVWMCHRVGASFLDTALHGFSGLVVLWSVLILVWLASDVRPAREATP